MTASLTFEIDGMSCGACAARAERAIAAVSGVETAQVNLADRRARITLQPGAVQAVCGALAAAGYPAVPERLRLQITGMTCATCVGRVEVALRAVPGVTGATVNLADGVARVTGLSVSPATLGAALAAAGYGAEVLPEGAAPVDRQAAEAAVVGRRFWWAAALTLPIFVAEMGGHLIPALHHWIAANVGTQASWLAQFILASAVLAGPGRDFFRHGWTALRRLAPDMNSLVMIGAGAAWGYSMVATFVPSLLPAASRAVYFEAAAVIVTLILLGRWLEARARGRTGAAIRRLVDLRPVVALVLRDGGQVEIPLAAVRRGDLVVLRPGARVPVDGVLRDGTGFVDESMLTGEPLPVEKAKGAKLVAGTLNGNAALTMRATAVGADTVLARIVALVAEAQGARLPVQDLVNRITLWFVPVVMALAALTVSVWLLAGPGLSFALVAGVSVLIIACPCAMGLATPVAIMVGTGRAAEMGVLFRRGDALQALQGVRVVAFDKTGTLTKGQPAVTDFAVLGDNDKTALFALVAAVEALSEHPLGAAVVREAKAQGLVLPPVSGFTALPGYGLQADVADSRVLVGALRLMAREGVDPAAFAPEVDRLSTLGRTPVCVAVDGRAAAVLGLADPVRATSRATVQALQAQGLRVVMMTGDTAATARAIAADLGITDVRADLLPEDKLAAIRALQTQGPVAFVGDGINDAPALAAADVGIAIGSGTDVAVESADVVLMAGDPGRVVDAIDLSRRTLAVVRQNLGWAFGYNVLLIPVAAGVLWPLWGILLSPALAAGAMAASSVLVVLNALRLRKVGA